MKKLTLLFLLALLLPLTASALVVDKVYYSLDNSNNTAEVVSCDDELGSVTIPATVTDDEGYTYTVTGKTTHFLNIIIFVALNCPIQ